MQRFTDSRGALFYGDVTVAAARDEDGSLVLLTKQVVDITEQTTSRRRLADLAARDPLTSLSNRSTVMQAIERALGAASEDAQRVGVLFADLDNFKLINETLGHIAGDELLKAVADRFTTYLGREAVVGRFGGDEFVIVAPQPADESLLTYYAHLMTQSLLDDFFIAGRRVVMTTSVGAALSRPGSTATGLLQDADVALSEAKRDGKARWRIQIFSGVVISRHGHGINETFTVRRLSHGVGVEKRDYMPDMFTADELDCMKRLRAAFDPLEIANPGKMFPQLHRCAELGRVVVHHNRIPFPDIPRF